MQSACLHVNRQKAILASKQRDWGSRCNQAVGRRGSFAICRAFSDPSASKRLMFLPGGAWFMSSDVSDAPVYGENFVMHSPDHWQGQHQVQGLVLKKQQPRGVAVRQPQSSDIIPLPIEDVEVSIVVLPVEEHSLGIVPFKQMVQDVDAYAIVPYEQQIPEPSASNDSSCLSIVPKDTSTMLGVVMGAAVRRRDDNVQLPMNDDKVYETFNSKHKRRTMKIKFTCKRCGATTIKPVNPHAWHNGTVFAKCGRCNITHKLVDNLKLFHELSGPVFNSPIQPQKDSSTEDGTPVGFEYDANGFPVLPERLQLRLNQWQAPEDFPDDISNLN